MSKILLTIEIDEEETDKDKSCVIRNYLNGEMNETYRPTSVERGAVDMVALILGFRPPRVLQSSDIPVR